jgi:probable FeS assembly SUF system protein SufT|tara:strand:- start:1696 stop:2241 length:546 start_codon:yes stop_codon:yes gene_type:complete
MKEVIIETECPAVLIPAGDAVVLPAGAQFDIMQALGGSVTLRGEDGLFRVAPEHFDALGADFVASLKEETSETPEEAFSDDLVWTRLRECFDPEIPLNIVDLGLVYDMQATELENGQYTVAVKMTLTAVGCGMGPTIASDAQSKIESMSSVASAEVDIVWDPQWTPHMISDEGRKVLGLDS